MTGTSNFLNVQIPERTKKVFVALDNDEAGEQMFQKCKDRFSNLNKAVSRLRPKTEYKDFNDELREGNILRVGRLAMVFQTADETQTHAWNNSSRAWEELDNSYRNPTRRGLRIANKLATVDLMELPLPSATEAN